MTNDLIKGVSELRRSQAEKSLYVFAKQYLGHHLKLEPSSAHREIYELLEGLVEKRGNRAAIAAPRGFGKSTLITLLYILYSVCWKHERYIMIFSHTASQAEQILENVKKEFEENELIRQDFPELFAMNGRKRKPRWSRDQIETLNGIKIQALSYAGESRGRKYGKYRPTLIIADDVETAESAASELARTKIKTWFQNTVLMLGDSNTNYILLGTLYHPLCLLKEYLSPDFNLEWDKRLYKVILQEAKNQEPWAQWSEIYNSRQSWQGQRGRIAARDFYEVHKDQMDDGVVLLWRERWSHYDLQVYKEEHVHAFYCELQGEPYDLRTAAFNVDKFFFIEKEWKSIEELLEKRRLWLEFFGSCDPCLGNDVTKGDFAAITIAARDREDGTIYIIDSDIRRMTPHDTVDRIIVLSRMYYLSNFFIETNNFQYMMYTDLKEQLEQAQLNVFVTEVNSTGNKIDRIHTLQSYIQRGKIKFSLMHERLLGQFRSFPGGDHDDGPDSVALLIGNLPKLPGSNGICFPQVFQNRTSQDPVFGITPPSQPNDYVYVNSQINDQFVPPESYDEGKEWINAGTILHPLFQYSAQKPIIYL